MAQYDWREFSAVKETNMDNDERVKQNALMDWQQELNAQKGRLPFLDGDEKTICEARIAECNEWIAKIKAAL